MARQVTLARAAREAGVSLWEMMDYVKTIRPYASRIQSTEDLLALARQEPAR